MGKGLKYGQDFYSQRHGSTSVSARKVLGKIVQFLPRIDSAVDLGCGVGTWLLTLKETYGVREVLGVEGEWLDRKLLLISESEFRAADLSHELRLGRKFDLAISLEVAEHIASEFAPVFVRSLVNASDFVLFSAAIPGQGGVNHYNEQWPGYWYELFYDEGYVAVDILRTTFWNDSDVGVQYRQNAILYVNEGRVADLRIPNASLFSGEVPLSLVHPDLFQSKVRRLSPSVRGALRILKDAVWRGVRRKFSIL
jgi:hypothetical protein